MSIDPTAPLRELRQTLPRANRTALEAAYKLWHHTFAPGHFEREAFSRYGAVYADSAKRDLAGYSERHERAIRAGRQTTDPLKKSGEFRSAFLGGYRFGAGMQRLRVTFPGLPRHVYYRNQYSGFSVVDAILHVTEHEREAMKKHYRATLAFQLKQDTARQKTFGRVTMQTD
ncbi:MAG: hypothetical protein WC372_09920 [Candidatus Neomarinimicrobiota bacterium]|jgi:hypothetical protein